MAEFFGTTAAAHKLEEFCHSPIFGMKKSHNLWILGQKEECISKSLENWDLILFILNFIIQIFYTII